jgi:hypothetical protein
MVIAAIPPIKMVTWGMVYDCFNHMSGIWGIPVYPQKNGKGWENDDEPVDLVCFPMFHTKYPLVI